MDIRDPERQARLTALVEECRPLEQDAAQRLLADRGVDVLDSIIVTWELLAPGPRSLGTAKEIVLSHHRPSVTVERAAEVADAVLAAPTPLIAIDGAGGSGKTTLAGAVAALLDGAVIVHGDDFYRPMPEQERERLDAEQGYERYFDWQRLRDQVLAPLRAGRPARYQRFDWPTGTLAAAWHEVAPGTTVIVEGVYTSRPELAPYYGHTTFVDTPREVCLQRIRARGENPEDWIMRWRAAEDFYLRTTWPQTRAHLLIRGD